MDTRMTGLASAWADGRHGQTEAWPSPYMSGGGALVSEKSELWNAMSELARYLILATLGDALLRRMYPYLPRRIDGGPG